MGDLRCWKLGVHGYVQSTVASELLLCCNGIMCAHFAVLYFQAIFEDNWFKMKETLSLGESYKLHPLRSVKSSIRMFGKRHQRNGFIFRKNWPHWDFKNMFFRHQNMQIVEFWQAIFIKRPFDEHQLKVNSKISCASWIKQNTETKPNPKLTCLQLNWRVGLMEN